MSGLLVRLSESLHTSLHRAHRVPYIWLFTVSFYRELICRRLVHLAGALDCAGELVGCCGTGAAPAGTSGHSRHLSLPGACANTNRNLKMHCRRFGAAYAAAAPMGTCGGGLRTLSVNRSPERIKTIQNQTN